MSERDDVPTPWAALEAPLSRERIRAVYNRIGRRYDLLRFAEDAPKRAALHALAPQPGERALDVGCGAGLTLVRIAQAVCQGQARERAQGPLVAGVDISPRMLAVTRERAVAAGVGDCVALAEGDACALPYPDGAFDLAFCGYVLDLLPSADIPRALAELQRTLRPGGRLALLALSPGASPAARRFTRAYEALYRRRPAWLAGCRPIEPEPLARAAGFTILGRREWFRGHPTMLVIARRPL